MTKAPRRRATSRIGTPRVQRRTRFQTTATSAAIALPALPAPGWKIRQPNLVAAALTCALLAVLFSFFNLDLFYIFDLDAVGLKHLTKDELARASGVIGYNSFFVNADAVERAVSKLPEVKAARVTVGLPNSLVIEVEERTPEAVWVRNNEPFWVDEEGIAFRARTNLSDLPTIRDLDQAPVKPGEKVTASALAAFQALRAAWPEAPHGMEWSAARGLTFVDERGWKICLGDASEMMGKLVKYRLLVQQLVGQNAKVKLIDLGKGDPYYQ